MSQSKKHRIILSGGGTGGHIYPAIAVANELKSKLEDVEILFVGANGKMEMEKVPKVGYRIVGLPIAGMHRGQPWRNLLLPLKLVMSLLKAWLVLKRFKADVVVGFGGYASGPLLKIAQLMNKPVVLQEQNSFAGVTNKILAKKAKSICVAYDGMEKFFPADKIKITGNPVRKDIYDHAIDRSSAFEYFGLDANKPTVLVIGGSLGAKTVNEAVAASVDRLKNKGVQVLWQTGKFYFEELRHFECDLVRVKDFVYRMDMAYAIADLVVSRAGALSVSELCLVNKPTILVPSPNVAEDHQTKNAQALEDVDAAVLVKDKDAIDVLRDHILALIINKTRLKELSDNISKLGKPNAASDIANEVIKQV